MSPLLRLLVFPCVLAAAGTLPAHEIRPYFFGERILVDAKLNGERVRYVFDTGADFTAIFQSTADRLQIETEEVREIRIGGHQAKLGKSKPVDVELFDKPDQVHLGILSFGGGSGIDGVFSWRDLHAPLLLIDGRDREVRNIGAMPAGKDWQRWKLEKDTRQLFFEVTANGRRKGRVFVDTGAGVGLRLSPALWNQWREQNPDVPVTLETFQYMVGPAYVYETAFVSEYRLGDLVFRDVDLGLIPGATGDGEATDGKGKPYVAMVGFRALRSLRLAIDREAGEIRTQSVSPVPRHNRLGAAFVPRSDRDPALVAHVVEGSPADRAGLKDGDVLLEIEGVDFSPSREDPNRKPEPLFHRPAGTVYTMKIERAGETHAIPVKLEDLLRRPVD